MNIVVTGGAGFIGSHVCEHLMRGAHRITIIDDLNDFYPAEEKLANLQHVRESGDFAFHQCDISADRQMLEIMATAKPDAVIHLAARAGVRPSLAEPLLYERVNVRGTLALLEAARLLGVSKFIFASSSSVYGFASRVPFHEDDPCLPVSPYAATKISGEKLCYTYSHLYKLQVVCLRFFTVYGPRQRPDLAIRKFTQRIKSGKPIQLFGDGSSARDYTFIDDIVAGILSALAYETPYDVFNLGNSSPVSLIDLLTRLEHVIGRRADVQWMPEQPGDVPITYADIQKAQRLLSYDPSTSFEKGLERFVEWYDKVLAGTSGA